MLRSRFVDGQPFGRIADQVVHIEPLDDGRHAWILASWQTYCPMWRVYLWALDNGALLDLEAGQGTACGISPPAHRVFVSSSSDEIRWIEVGGGATGAVKIERGEFAACSRDGRHISMFHRNDRRENWWTIYRVEDSRQLGTFPGRITFSDDGHHAVYADDDTTLVRFGLSKSSTVSRMLQSTTRSTWLGIRAVRGRPAVVAVDGSELVVVDLERAEVATRLAVDGEAAGGLIRGIGDATANHVVVLRASLDGEVIELATGRSVVQLGRLAPAALVPDGTRVLRNADRALDVIELATGARAYSYSGHGRIAGRLAWSGDGSMVAAASDRVRVIHLDGAAAASVTELATGEGGKLVFAPDGMLWIVDAFAIEGWNPTTATRFARYSSLQGQIHSAQISHDGTQLVLGSYAHGTRIVELATGKHVLDEHSATKLGCAVGFAGGTPHALVACARERIQRLETVRWTRLDARGRVVDRGAWERESPWSSIEVMLAGTTVLVTAYSTGHELHRIDLAAPDPAATAASIPLVGGAVLLDARGGRALLREVDELVYLDWSTGEQLERIRCTRRPAAGALSPDGRRIAIAYADGGVEVVERADVPRGSM